MNQDDFREYAKEPLLLVVGFVTTFFGALATVLLEQESQINPIHVLLSVAPGLFILLITKKLRFNRESRICDGYIGFAWRYSTVPKNSIQIALATVKASRHQNSTDITFWAQLMPADPKLDPITIQSSSSLEFPPGKQVVEFLEWSNLPFQIEHATYKLASPELIERLERLRDRNAEI